MVRRWFRPRRCARSPGSISSAACMIRASGRRRCARAEGSPERGSTRLSQRAKGGGDYSWRAAGSGQQVSLQSRAGARKYRDHPVPVRFHRPIVVQQGVSSALRDVGTSGCRCFGSRRAMSGLVDPRTCSERPDASSGCREASGASLCARAVEISPLRLRSRSGRLGTPQADSGTATSGRTLTSNGQVD
jgi:hypothetical protein